MLTQTRYTTTDDGHCIQVAVTILSDTWEPLCSSYTNLGPFDDVEVLTSELQLRMRSWGRTLHLEPAPPPPSDQQPLPFLP
uniref:Uncharacterized protein n=1 Tax=uncultured prokaryote TaxID=198431 RepID=A0A0H5PZJ4_9ZZZZ|nr:hypothetical protein [uncultured prokaryote]